jgi:hypothetical protein
MAKGLPYFKFDTSEWLSGDIVFEDMVSQGLFINLCALYWQKGGDLSIQDIDRRFKDYPNWRTLTERYISLSEDKIAIKFLDEQFAEREYKSKINSLNGSKGGEAKAAKLKDIVANAKQTPTKRLAKSGNKEGEIEEEKEQELEKDIYKSKREFYEKEISDNLTKEQIEGYKNMVKYIFGENPIKVPLDRILKAKHQLRYESFVELIEIQSKSTKKLRDILLSINGYEKTQYTILFSALKQWFND